MKTFLKINMLLIAGLLLLFPFSESRAATKPELLLTWSADVFAPQGYSGKLIPSKGSTITAALELIDGGKIINLSPYEVRWYRGDNLFKKGKGLKRISLTIDVSESIGVPLKAVVVGYKGVEEEATMGIPAKEPELIIDAPYPLRRVSDATIELRALPYFFNIENISDLIFKWQANGISPQGGSEASDILELTLSSPASGSTISVSVSAENTNDASEIKQANIILTIQ